MERSTRQRTGTRSWITNWTITMALVCVVLAWPLHEARHASEPIGAAAQTETALSDGSASDVDGPEVGGAYVAKPCIWCMFHGEHYLDLGVMPSLSFHAEASAPPRAVSCGRPAGPCTLAAEPRGPPPA